MMAIPDSARRYLLGEASNEECARIEQEYFEREDAIDRIAAAEDDLIEDYLADQLTAADRDRFERVYLSTPQHRVRVETVRRLMALAGRSAQGDPAKGPAASSGPSRRYRPWLALAASLLVIASVGLWRFSHFNRRSSEVVTNPAPQRQAPVAQTQRAPALPLRVFALTLSSVTVRDSSYHPSAAIPAGTDVVAILLEGDGENRPLTARRAIIRTVGGREVWRGPVTTDRDRPSGIIGRIDVPAASVPADDYMVVLYGTDQRGTEVEWAQYFLRVRAK